MTKSYFTAFARYNRWANRRLYDAAEALPEDRLWLDRQAFFGSLMGTLNHILVADRLWLARFEGLAAPGLTLDQVLHRDLPALRQAREAEDERITGVVGGLTEDRMAGNLAYRNTTGQPFEQPWALVLGHFFNHQTHHRGQAHTLVGQLGGDPPPLDFAYFMRE